MGRWLDRYSRRLLYCLLDILVLSCPVHYNIVHYCTVHYCTVHYNYVQYCTVQYCTNIVQLDIWVQLPSFKSRRQLAFKCSQGHLPPYCTITHSIVLYSAVLQTIPKQIVHSIINSESDSTNAPPPTTPPPLPPLEQ